jgi:bacterioferritin-associated ferredoxin
MALGAIDKTVAQTVQNMISEIGELRKIVAIDSMPDKLQKVRQLLRELDEEFYQKSKQ